MKTAANVETIRVRQVSNGEQFDATRISGAPEAKGKQVLATDIEGGAASGQLYVINKGTVTGPWEIVEN